MVPPPFSFSFPFTDERDPPHLFSLLMKRRRSTFLLPVQNGDFFRYRASIFFFLVFFLSGKVQSSSLPGTREHIPPTPSHPPRRFSPSSMNWTLEPLPLFLSFTKGEMRVGVPFPPSPPLPSLSPQNSGRFGHCDGPPFFFPLPPPTTVARQDPPPFPPLLYAVVVAPPFRSEDLSFPFFSSRMIEVPLFLFFHSTFDLQYPPSF